VLDSTQVQDRPVGVIRMGEKLVFWRNHQGLLSCLHDRCVHRGVALSKGKIIHDKLQCPFHGFEFDASGRVTLIPANGKNASAPKAFKVQDYPVHEARGLIWIWWGKQPPADLKAPRFFDDLGPEFSFARAYDPWHAHYSRVIENQLDVMHLPFIHYNTIGRGNRTLVDGPGVKWIDEDLFYVYPHNRVDDGSTPLRPGQISLEESRPFKLEFLFPNLWQNYISEQVRILAAFVPVDQEHTILYLRFYQKALRFPILSQIFNQFAMPFNVYIAHQDRRVVETQQPRISGLRIGEQLVAGDFPIIEYRRRRAELIQLNQDS
jgi:phenylpropionate dioxygenase-like ring-hydroxylating dioxygenase large terminal subunit